MEGPAGGDMASPNKKKPEHENLRQARIKQHLDAAEGYLLLDMYKDSLAEVSEVLGLDPENIRALHLSGMLCIQTQDFERAEESFLKVLDADPDRADVYIHLAYLYRRTRGLEAAIEALEEALMVFDRIGDSSLKKVHLPLANYNLSCYYSQKNDIQNALHHLTIAVELDSHYAKVAASDPDFDPIKSDSGFEAILRERRRDTEA